VTATYADLQTKLREHWPAVSMRSIGSVTRTVVVVHSIGVDVPDHMSPIFPAYEERFLAFVLSLLRAPASRVVYVTSNPIHPRVLDYYFSLVPELDTAEARSRFFSVCLVDGKNEPLARKLLARPRAVRRVKELIGDPELAMLVPFCVTDAEVDLAVALDLPVYGADPELLPLGTKTGSRRIFAEEGVNHPIGLDIEPDGDLKAALDELRRRRPEARSAIVKLDAAVSGLGNAIIDLAQADGDLHDALELEDERKSVDEYLAALARTGGIVEERIEGDDFRSPSVQFQVSPAGQVEVLSTHDQMLGGRHGQTYLGCRFPADPGYAEEIAVAGLKVGRRLAREGVIGRAAVDFVSVRDGDGDGAWRNYAVEINLRCGGTTHPLLALTALTDGRYDALAAEYRTRNGAIKHYVAADNLGSPAYRSLTPDDLLDIVEERGLGWDPEQEAGIVLHMVSALAAAGRVGMTAIGDDPADASRRYDALKAALDEAAAEAVPA
jgi:hypothetical protein